MKLECYSANAKSIFVNGKAKNEEYLKIMENYTSGPETHYHREYGVTYSSYRYLQILYQFLKKYLGKSAPSLSWIGSVNLTLCLNEIEILSWCYGVYLFLVEDASFFQQLRSVIGDNAKIVLKFQSAEEMLLSCAIFAKMVNNQQDDFT